MSIRNRGKQTHAPHASHGHLTLNMEKAKSTIPYYHEINEFLESIPSAYRTDDPLLFCLRLKENDGAINNYKPPYKKSFYFMALVKNAGATEITYDHTNVTNLNSFLVFQSPGLVYSFMRDNSASGYLIYFMPECFSFFKPDFEKEFPFFDLLHTNFYQISQSRFNELAPHFDDVFAAYGQSSDPHHRVARAKLLALLYQMKEYTAAFNQWEEGFTTPQQLLFKKFLKLVNNFYLEKKNVGEYAAMLSVTPNHLSQSIKSATGKNARSFIDQRIMEEARSLMLYTQSDVAEIAYQLNFSDPANFGRFFKKHAGIAPLQYRKQGQR